MKCVICGKEPNELVEYKVIAEMEGTTPERFVRDNEGTYNEKEDIFCCTNCYINIGQPYGRATKKWSLLRG